MLVHLIPAFLSPSAVEKVTLVDLKSSELGIWLNGDNQVVARRDKLSSRRWIASPKSKAQPAALGIIVVTPAPLDEFTVTTRWRTARGLLAVHTTRYIVLDKLYDTVTEKMSLWAAQVVRGREWPCRTPSCYTEMTGALPRPRMKVPGAVSDPEPNDPIGADVRESVSEDGLFVRRIETFFLPTVERGRLTNRGIAQKGDVPSIKTAFSGTGQIASMQHD